MSLDMSVFVRGVDDGTIESLLQKRFGVNFTSTSGALVAEVFGVSIARVRDHELEEDCGIEYPRYPSQVSFTLYSGRIEPESGSVLCASMALAFARTLRMETGASYLVVEGMQRIVDAA